MKKRLEYHSDSSAKFWQIDVKGTSHTVQFGRVGSDGQRKSKQFASAAEARSDADKLIKAKLNKGYVAASKTVKKKASTNAQRTSANKSGRTKPTTKPKANKQAKAASKPNNKPPKPAKKIHKSDDLRRVSLELAALKGGWKSKLPKVREVAASISTAARTRKELDDLLYWAASNGNTKQLQVLAELGANPETIGYYGASALAAAAQAGHAKIVSKLLDLGVRPDQPKSKHSALANAAENGHTRITEMLLELGAKVPKGTLRMAARNRSKGAAAICRMLIDAGVNVDELRFETPLMTACRHGAMESARLLIECGANVNRVVKQETPLHCALEDRQCLELLLANGAHIAVADRCQNMALIELAKKRNCRAAMSVLPGPENSAGSNVSKPKRLPTIEKLWQRILVARKRTDEEKPGRKATARKLDRLEADMGCKLPKDLRSVWLVHGSCPGLVPFNEYRHVVTSNDDCDVGFDLLSPDECYKDWCMLHDLHGDTFDVGTSQTGIQDEFWHPGWIPIAADRGGEFMCVDTVPAAGGTKGQVIVTAGSNRLLLAATLRQLFADIVEALGQSP